MRDDGEVGEKSNDRVLAVLKSSIERYIYHMLVIRNGRVGLPTLRLS